MPALATDINTSLESNRKSVDKKSSPPATICQTRIFYSDPLVAQLRLFWIENLPHLESDKNKLARHADCCKHGWIVRHKHTGELRIRYNSCGYRFCPHCLKSFQVQTREKLLSVVERETDLKFITLTLAANDLPLAEQLKHLKNSFRRLRQQKIWIIQRGYAVTEITYNPATDRWHPHLHIICQGPYIAQEHLSKAWKKASSGSYIVDIRAITDKKHATNYLTSYLAKMDSTDKSGKLKILSWPIHRLQEWYKALKYRRLVLKFGTWPALPKQAQDETLLEPDAWEIVSSIEELAALLPNEKAAQLLKEFGYAFIINQKERINTS